MLYCPRSLKNKLSKLSKCGFYKTREHIITDSQNIAHVHTLLSIQKCHTKILKKRMNTLFSKVGLQKVEISMLKGLKAIKEWLK